MTNYFVKYACGKPVRIHNLSVMPLDEFAFFINLISNKQIFSFLLQCARNENLTGALADKVNRLWRWENEISDMALERIEFFQKEFAEILKPAEKSGAIIETAPPLPEKTNIIAFNPQGKTDIIGELVGALKLKPEPEGGKYYKPDDLTWPKFIAWLVEENYGGYLDASNFFDFLHCELPRETVKRYFRQAMNAAGLKNPPKIRRNG